MPLLTWIIVVAIAWMGVAALVGVMVGRAIRLRDSQVPRDRQVPDSRQADQDQARPEAERPSSPSSTSRPGRP